MKREELENEILHSINDNLTEGWCNLTSLGHALRTKGIDFREYGYDKLFQMVRDFRRSIVWKIDDDTNPGYRIIDVRAKSENERKKFEKFQAVDNESKIDFSSDPKNALTRWCSLGDYNSTLAELEKLVLPERWYYQEKNSKFPFPILSNYLKYTFYRLTQEKGKIMENESYAAFNTGLVDRRYEPIYAFFEKTPKAIKKFRLINFCIAGEEREGKELIRQFENKPESAHYFENVTDMIYDTRASWPECDWNHIIVENIDRLPKEFIEDNAPKGFTLKETRGLTIDEQQEYFAQLAEAVRNDNKAYRNITFRLKDSLDLALKRVKWNFKTAIPQYYPTMNKMSLLLPLAIQDDEVVDLALVVEKTKSNNYLGHTILPLDWAYSNARLVCRPDSDWLVAEQINEQLGDEHVFDLEK